MKGLWVAALAMAALVLGIGGTLGQQAPDPAPEIAQMAVLEDGSGQMTLADVLSADAGFVPVRSMDINPGYTSSIVWVRIIVRAAVAETALLALAPNFVDLIDVYVGKPGAIDGPEDFTLTLMGDHRPLPDDDISGLDNVVRLSLEPGQPTRVYVRLRSVNSALSLSPTVYASGAHSLRTTVTSLAFGAWFGGMAILIVTQLVFFSFDRRASYLLIAASMLGAVLVYGGTGGLSRLILFPDGGMGNDLFTALSIWFGQSATCLAAASVLDLYARKRVSFWFLMAGALFGLMGMVMTLLGFHRAFTPYGSAVMLILGVLIAYESVRIAMSGGLEARLNAAAYVVLLLGLMITLVQRLGLVPVPVWNGHAYALSNLVHAVLLTGAMAVRLRAAEMLNHTMRLEALSAAKAAQVRADQLVEERTRELAAAKRVAEDALRAELASQQQQVRFMEVISHQYRTPLAGLRSNLDSVGLSLPANDHANRLRLERARSSIARLVEVLEINATRARLQGAAFAPRLVACQLGAILDPTVARARDLLNGATITTEIAPEAAAALVRADEAMASIAIINLLENAVKFTPQPSPRVWLEVRLSGGSALIVVRDEGIGIPEDELAGIIEPEVRGANAHSIAGTGMGLSLVHRIVSAHGGTLRLESTLGAGTRVTIALAIAEPGENQAF